MTCFVYVLGCRAPNGWRTYVGWTTDLDRRLGEHNAGTGARSTRGYAWFLLYAERHAARGEAMSREWRLKRDRVFRKSLIKPFEECGLASYPADRRRVGRDGYAADAKTRST